MLLTSCSASQGYTPLNNITESYSLEDAINDGCVVFDNSQNISGQSVWDDFVKNTELGKSDFVRLVLYLAVHEDLEWLNPDYYEQVKDDDPTLYIMDLEFDGEEYHLSLIENQKPYSFTYKYMKKLTYSASDPDLSYPKKQTYYLLVNDDTVTWEKLNEGMDHKAVYFYNE